MSRTTFVEPAVMLKLYLMIFCSLLAGIFDSAANAQDPDLSSLQLETWPQLYIADLDGGNLKKLLPESEGRAEGSPSISRDGKKLAFDSWDAAGGERNSDASIFLVDLESGEETKLTKGSMPELSPQGHRLFFCRHDDRGVWIASVHETEKTLTKIDNKGWGTAWSPDGQKLAWASYRNGYNIKIIDIIEGREWLVFQEEPSPFRVIYYNFDWSPDSRNLVFKGVTHARKTGVYAVDVIDERQPVLLNDDGKINHSFAWHPEGTRVLLSQPHPESQQFNLYWIEPLDPEKEPVRVDKLPAELIATDPCFTPDGQQIIFSARISENDEEKGNEKVVP